MLQGLMLDVNAYTAMSSACVKAQDAKHGFQTFYGAVQQGLMLDVIAYNAVCSACEKAQVRSVPSKPTGPCSSSAPCLTSLPTTP